MDKNVQRLGWMAELGLGLAITGLILAGCLEEARGPQTATQVHKEEGRVFTFKGPDGKTENRTLKAVTGDMAAELNRIADGIPAPAPADVPPGPAAVAKTAGTGYCQVTFNKVRVTPFRPDQSFYYDFCPDNASYVSVGVSTIGPMGASVTNLPYTLVPESGRWCAPYWIPSPPQNWASDIAGFSCRLVDPASINKFMIPAVWPKVSNLQGGAWVYVRANSQVRAQAFNWEGLKLRAKDGVGRVLGNAQVYFQFLDGSWFTFGVFNAGWSYNPYVDGAFGFGPLRTILIATEQGSLTAPGIDDIFVSLPGISL